MLNRRPTNPIAFRCRLALIASAVLCCHCVAVAEEVSLAGSATEPFSESFSLTLSHDYLEAAANQWYQTRHCVTCHTNGLYLLSSPVGSDARRNTQEMAREYLATILGLDGKEVEEKPSTEAVTATAALLTISESAQGKLHPITEKGLDEAWARQSDNGCWADWLKCNWPPYEVDNHFGVTLMAIAMGSAPEAYRKKPHVQEGIARLRVYLKKNPPETTHQQAMLLWASMKLPGLLQKTEREAAVRELIALQHKDGGWNLITLGRPVGSTEAVTPWLRTDDTPHDWKSSDGYATGFVCYVLQQVDEPATFTPVRRGLGWLKRNQRSSGRWYTRSPRRDRYHFISNAGTSFAVLALSAAEE